MSDIPTKTYPPEFLQRLIDDHEAERQADTGLPTQHRGDNLLQVEATELPSAAFADIEFEKAGATPEESSAVETKGDAMRDIERVFTIWDSGILPADGGDRVRYADHRFEVERLKNAIDHLTSERDEARAEVERRLGDMQLLAKQIDLWKAASSCSTPEQMLSGRRFMDARIHELTRERDGWRSDAERMTAERDAAQAEVERLTAERDQTANRPKGREVGRVGLDHAYINAIPPPRPTDEDIWREAFMRQLHDHHAPNWATTADAALAEYRKRWPR